MTIWPKIYYKSENASNMCFYYCFDECDGLFMGGSVEPLDAEIMNLEEL